MEPRNAEAGVELTVPPERLAATVLISAFFGLVLLLMGLAAGLWPMCAAGGGVILLGVLWALYRRGCRIRFGGEQVVVITPFSRETHPYAGMNFLLRRSWTGTFRRGGTATGLAGTAIQLRRGRRPVVTVQAGLWRGRAVREAIAFLEKLPNPRRYL